MKLDILYASTTGNAEMVAKKLMLLSKEAGFQSRMYEMNDFDFESFSKLKNVAIVTSTYGDGDVPDMGTHPLDAIFQTSYSQVCSR